MAFASLEQRMAQSYMDMFPSFVPDKNAGIHLSQQKEFYGLIKNLYQLAFDEPLLFVPTLHEDDAYPSRYKKSYGKPELIIHMRKFTKAVDTLLSNMFLAGKGNNVKWNKRQRAILAKLGVTDLTNLPAAWVWMSKRDNASLTAFSYCLFDSSYPYSSEIYARLLGEQAFKKLESWMLSQGYERFDIDNVTASDCKLILTIANPKWSKDKPRGGFEYKIKHTGISAQYDYYAKEPVVFGLCVPNGLKQYLEEFSSMDNELQEFIVKRAKKCDSCKYCVQLDKTGSRQLAYIPVEYEGKEYPLCPYFPGYSFFWNSIDENLVENLIRMLSFMDRFAPNRTESKK